MIQTATKTFAKNFNLFFKQILDQRIILMNKNQSKKNECFMNKSIDKLKPYHDLCFNDTQTALFIIKNELYLRAIMIESHTKTIDKFYHLLSQANETINHPRIKITKINRIIINS